MRDRAVAGKCLALVLGLAVTVAGCSDAKSPTLPSQHPNDGPVSPGAPIATSGDADLAAVRRATAPFHNIALAYAAGYTTENEPCVSSPAGVMGIHAPNFSLINDQVVEPTQPELLLYVPQPNGGYRLVGVEYFLTVLLLNPRTNEVAPWFSQDPWPPEYQVVTPTPVLFGETFQGPMPGHTPTMPWHWDLHVWVWAYNPSGMFEEWNPSLQCEV